jgi:UPF0176 protein
MITIAAFYKFARFDGFEAARAPLQAASDAAGIRGTILLAPEGVNGTIAGTRAGVDAVLGHIRALPGFADLELKESRAPDMPFHRMKVRLKREIVTLGVEGIDPKASHERYIAPEEWNAVISDPETVVIDTRNDYEVAIGSFEGAIDPKTASFGAFPEWFRRFRAENRFRRVAMFCTGGIRCEKSTAFLRAQGVEEVVHLKGGILKYLETVPEDQSLWRGECFVFDHRVSVGHGLKPGTHDICHACRRPVSQDQKASPLYVEGVSCPACRNEFSEEHRARFAERQRQTELAAARGEAHIGPKRP